MQSQSKYVTLIFVVICLGISAFPVVAQNQAFEHAEKTPVGVHSVSADGFWTSGNAEGFYRTVVVAGGVEHVTHRLFIQWLQNDPGNQRYKLIRTVNVTELNLGAGHVLDVKTNFGDINLFKISVTATSRGRKVKRFVITAKGEGGYVIRSR